jgi:hypothetical protein
MPDAILQVLAHGKTMKAKAIIAACMALGGDGWKGKTPEASISAALYGARHRFIVVIGHTHQLRYLRTSNAATV